MFLAGVSFQVCRLRNASVEGCFIGNAGVLSSSATLGSVAARMRLHRGEESTLICIPPTFSASSVPQIVFFVMDPVQVKIAVGLFGTLCLQGRTSFLKFGGRPC